MEKKQIIPLSLIVIGGIAAFGLYSLANNIEQKTAVTQQQVTMEQTRLKSYEELDKNFGYQGSDTFEATDPVYVLKVGEEEQTLVKSKQGKYAKFSNSNTTPVSVRWDGNDLKATAKAAGGSIVTLTGKSSTDTFKILVLVKE